MAKHSVSKTKPVTGEISGDRSLRFLLLLLLLHYKTERLYRGYGEGDPELKNGGLSRETGDESPVSAALHSARGR